MPLNRLDNFIKNTEGRILYVSPVDLDSSDSIDNTGNSLARPFKTLQRALLESARFSYVRGNSNDETEKTTILLMPGEHEIDNRPGYSIFNDAGQAKVTSADGTVNSALAGTQLPLSLDSNFDLTQSNNDLYKFNSVYGGVIVPRGTSIVGLDLRKTKIRPKYIPNPTDDSVDNSSIFRITGACYFWQFSIFDGDEFGLVYTQPDNFGIESTPTFSHHKLTVFEYADGVNQVGSNELTDLEMYYAKLSIAYGTGTGREVDSEDIFPTNEEGFNPQRPEYEIVGAFAADPLIITNIKSGNGSTPTNVITVTTQGPHGLNAGTPIRISGVSDFRYNISTKVVDVDDNLDNVFTYTVTGDVTLINADISNEGIVTVETDTVSGASPYIFNISMRSGCGMNGMHADGSKATGFRSMVVAQFTGVSLQKDDRAFVQYNESSRQYENAFYSTTVQTGAELSANSSSSGLVYHLESDAVYRKGWEQTHIRISNDAILQIVSVFAIGFNKHFACESGGDASITNSNSNFGQLSLISDGFKKEAFGKDNKAFITHLIPPRAIDSTEENIDWLAIDLTKPNTTTKLYINGFNNEAIVPPILTQGYRIGAKLNDRLYLGSDSALIVTPTGESAYKTYPVGAPSSNVFTLSSGTHTLSDGEKVVIISDDGDLPENLQTNTVYYVIIPANNQIKLAASEAEALAGDAITVYGGTNLTITSRIVDKVAGDEGHPVQYDINGWYINVSSTGNTIGALSGSGASELTYVKRTPDNRSLDEKIYKVRVVVPSQLSNAKTPEAGFIFQESSSTGFRDNTDPTLTTIDNTDYDYNRNPGFISTCSRSSTTVTVVTELPHRLQVGDSVIIKNVTDDSSAGDAYNGTYTVTVINSALEFEYETTLTPGTFTNDVNSRTTDLPRFERNDLQSNLYVYRNEIIKEYEEGNKTGIYHLYTLNASNQIQEEFTDLEYSQDVTNLYPQLDRDNENDNPNSSTSYALRSPIGGVATNDLKKSLTRESADLLLTTLGIGRKITNVSSTAGIATITFDRDHGLGGIVVGEKNATTSGFTPGTYYNVKLYNESGLLTWDGATAKVVVAAGGDITSVDIMNGGSGYSAGTYYLDTSVIGGGSGNDYTVSASGISDPTGNVVQFTGIGTGTDIYHRITSVSDTNQIEVAKTSGDPTITTNNYALIISPSTTFSASGDTITATAHDLTVGNKFRSIDGSNNNVGDYIVDTVVDVNTFTVSGGIGAVSGRILKHGLSSNEGLSDRSNENLQARAITIFDNETLTLTETGGITASDTAFAVSNSGIGTIQRFPLGSYLQVDGEIMRVASDSLSGLNGDEITVIRGSLATKATSHDENSLIKKVKIPSIEFRRPSIIRASGHTFEYLGYGPGNYSTALPQVQDRTLTEREEFLSQAQERSSGIVVYTGMNNKGDFYIGNQKKSAATGEESTFDTPIPTVTGEDPSRLSVVFDEVIVKERIVVEGGDSGQVLSQFDGPVNFNGEIKSSNKVKITDDTESTSNTSGALTVSGGVGIGSDLNVGGDANIDGTVTAPGADIGNVQIAVTDDQTIDTTSGDLILDSASNTVNINADTNIIGVTTITGDTNIIGDLDLTNSPSNEGRISANYLDVPNISPVGSIMAWPGAVNTWPTQNWRLCNGAALNRTTYADLFGIISTTYGNGDGSTTFNLPNLSSRFIGGVGNSPLDTLGNTGGNNNAVLISHNHGITDPGHDHGYTDTVARNGNNLFGDESARVFQANTATPSTTNSNVTGITINSYGINNAGSVDVTQTGTDANLPPYMALYWIIRIQ